MSSEIQLKCKSIGPLESTNAKLSLAADKAVVYARNGSGKTFISRMFRLSDHSVCKGSRSDSFLSQGARRGEFLFSETPDQGLAQTLSVTLEQGDIPLVTNDSNYLFHVFNTDFVAENLASREYVLSGDIEGFIVGKQTIDTEYDEIKLKQLEQRGIDLRALLENAIVETKKELKGAKVSPNVSEFKRMDFAALLEEPYVEFDQFDTIKEQLMALQYVEEDSPNVHIDLFDASFPELEEIKILLETPHTRSSFSQEFLSFVQPNIEFVRTGVQLHHADNASCPFCGQSVSYDAAHLISEYEAYIGDKEAEIIETIQLYKQSCTNFSARYTEAYAKAMAEIQRFNEIKQGFSDHRSIALPELPSVDLIKSKTKAVIEALNEKSKDISVFVDGASIFSLAQDIALITSSFTSIQYHMDDLNEAKSKVSKLRLSLRKELCKERFKKLRHQSNVDIQEYHHIKSEYKSSREALLRKLESSKIPKRVVVAEIFESLLEAFFGDKYAFNKQTFHLSFRNNALSEGADKVLSEGEKTIIAFCYYLASSALLVEKESDYQKLFFVIDDPISNLDSVFIATVSRVLAELARYLPLPNTSPNHLWILTHNEEFRSALVQNGVVDTSLVLDQGILSERQEIDPYKAFGVTP